MLLAYSKLRATRTETQAFYVQGVYCRAKQKQKFTMSLRATFTSYSVSEIQLYVLEFRLAEM